MTMGIAKPSWSAWVGISHHSGRLFRSIPATHFGAFRPPRVGVKSMS